jgi:hypothetical protein
VQPIRNSVNPVPVIYFITLVEQLSDSLADRRCSIDLAAFTSEVESILIGDKVEGLSKELDQ